MADLKRILIVDDDDVTCNLLAEVFEKHGFSVTTTLSGESALELIQTETFDVVVSDVRLGAASGIDILTEIKIKQPRSVVVLMTAFGDHIDAISAIKEGAFDYISKPFNVHDLRGIVSRALEEMATSTERTPLELTRTRDELKMGYFAGSSPGIVEIYKTIARATNCRSNVLISGESGVGKELVARTVHKYSKNSTASFIAIDCSLYSDDAIRAIKVPFTEGSTLLLDNVSDLNPQSQSKLFGLLRHMNCRVISTSVQSLEEMVKQGEFREDLFYHLRVIRIHLPPLRERTEDLNDLIEVLLVESNRKTNKKVSHVSKEAMDRLTSYAWPGNMNELKAVIEYAVATSKSSQIFKEDLPSEVVKSAQSGQQSLQNVEREAIRKALADCKNNRSRAAATLGIDRGTFYRRAHKHGLL